MFSVNYLSKSNPLQNYKRYILFFPALIILLNNAYGQERFVDFKGVVLNLKDSTALPFVNIAIQDIGTGGISNEEGQFLINIKERYLEDSIVFSSIGFTPVTLSIKESVAKDSLTVYMEQSSTFLPEITVTSSADSALMILKKAIKSINKNYPVKPYLLEGFYREANIENDKYARLVEAAFTIDDKGYRKPLSKMNFKLNQLRKSDDLREIDWYGAVQEWVNEKNGLVNFMMNDLMRKNTQSTFATFIETAILSRINREDIRSKKIQLEKYFHDRNIEIVAYSSFENEPVWVIEITSDNNSRGFMGLVSEGKVYVQQKNFAILGYDFYLKAKPKQLSTKELLKKPIRDKNYETMKRFAIDGENLLSRSVRYSRYKGRYYLSYMDTKMSGTSSRFLGSNRRNNSNESEARKIAKFYEHKQLMISKININKKEYSKIKKKDRMNKDIALHNTEFLYEPSFWKNYNIVKRNPLGKEVAIALSLNKKLEVQFQANEKPHIQASRLSAQEKNYMSYTDNFNKIEYLKELNDSTLLLTGISNDETYGFTPENPVLLGTRSVYGNSRTYPTKYLNALTDTKKREINYQFKGYTNPFKTPNSRAVVNNNPDLSFGLLVRCEIWEEGSSNKKTIYLNLNDEGGEVLAPKGFKYKKN